MDKFAGFLLIILLLLSVLLFAFNVLRHVNEKHWLDNQPHGATELTIIERTTP